MNKLQLVKLFFSIVLLLPIYTTYAEEKSSQSDVLFDLEPPEIKHTQYDGIVSPNEALTVEALITDNAGVHSVTLFYRVPGSSAYRSLAMQLSVDKEDSFSATIPAQEVIPPSLEYYIQATDTGGNTVLRGATVFPLTVAIGESGAPATAPSSTAAKAMIAPTATGAAVASTAKKKNYTWAWIAGGVLVTALIAASSSDDGGDPDPKPKGTISISAPQVE